MTAPQDEGLPRGWFSPGRNRSLWGEGSTYQRVPYEELPPLPKRPGDELAWLRATSVPSDPLDVIDTDDPPSVEEFGPKIDLLTAEAKKLGFTVPPMLRPFMTDPDLHGHVPTCTACYIDLPDRLVPLPEGQPGRLLRFLNDQQCCLLWYLHLTPEGGHSVVCAWPEWDDDADGESLEDFVTPCDLVVCSPSFEDFIHRFWLKNTLWYAVRAKRRLTEDEQAYVDAAKRSRSMMPSDG
jgi:hypothetical protein